MQRIETGRTRAENIVVKDVLEFYSPNILSRTQHTNVLFDRRREGGEAGVYSTQYTVQWPLYTRTLRRPRL